MTVTPYQRNIDDLRERLGRYAGIAEALSFLSGPGPCGGNRALLVAAALPTEMLEALAIAARNARKPRNRWRRSIRPAGDHHRYDECVERPGEFCGRGTCEACPTRYPDLRNAARVLERALRVRREMDEYMWHPQPQPREREAG